MMAIVARIEGKLDTITAMMQDFFDELNLQRTELNVQRAQLNDMDDRFSMELEDG